VLFGEMTTIRLLPYTQFDPSLIGLYIFSFVLFVIGKNLSSLIGIVELPQGVLCLLPSGYVKYDALVFLCKL